MFDGFGGDEAGLWAHFPTLCHPQQLRMYDQARLAAQVGNPLGRHVIGVDGKAVPEDHHPGRSPTWKPTRRYPPGVSTRENSANTLGRS
jgi:hypothetical protein